MRTLSVLALALLLAGCDALSDGPRELPAVDASAAASVETADALAEARDAWVASGIDDYEVRYRRYCFCAGELFQVRVEAGRVVEAWVDGLPAPDDPPGEYLTVDRLFDIAIDAFDRADRASAQVLPGRAPFFYSVSADYAFEVADEEVGYEVVGFEALD